MSQIGLEIKHLFGSSEEDQDLPSRSIFISLLRVAQFLIDRFKFKLISAYDLIRF